MASRTPVEDRPEFKAMARKAAKSPLHGKELADEFGVTTAEAHQLAAVGHGFLSIETCELTESERRLMRAIAAVRRRLLYEGISRTPESKEVAWFARKGAGWPAATARKRLFVDRYDPETRRTERGLGFVEVSGNGYISLTPAGWAVILWTEIYKGGADG